MGDLRGNYTPDQIREFQRTLGLTTIHPSWDQLRTAFKEAAKRFHPDAPGGSAEQMTGVNRAWDYFKARTPKTTNGPKPGDQEKENMKKAQEEAAKKTAEAKAKAKEEPPKAEPPKGKPKVKPSRPQGIGTWCRERIAKHPNESNGQIAKLAAEKFASATTADCIAWYRSKMRRENMEAGQSKKATA